MKKVKFLKNDRGSENGSIVTEYKAGKTYSVGDDLYDAFVNHRKTAVPVEEKAIEPKEAAVVPKAPENKAIVPEENKSAAPAVAKKVAKKNTKKVGK